MSKLLFAALISVPLLGACQKEPDQTELQINTRMEEQDVTVPSMSGEDTISVKVPDVDIERK